MKAMKIITTGLPFLAAALVIFSGIIKLMGGEEVNRVLSGFGVGQYRVILGLMEIGFAILFLIPRTNRIGFLLLSCYFAGAMGTELSHGTSFNALTPIALVWVATFLRDRDVFLGSPAKQA
ncbi:DoxX family protein [Flavihumibacter profundi]|uniref:DoxX family protein n=1 Tax=Flavihumibacter profundi TaxID=2716883 RepID=UPI001CC41479|nr:DoxX family protein [Flavihumibacter profundi]MBZ5858384.1 DoxX family protein [Flavihumibacter profundi]